MIGYEVTLKDTKNKEFYLTVATIAKDETQAINFARAEAGEGYEVVKTEEVKEGVIMRDSFYE